MIRLPISFVRERYLTRRENQPPFVQKATFFEDFVIRCVRYAFANIPPRIGRVFFAEAVARPFLRFRMIRHGYLRSPISWRKHSEVRRMSPALASPMSFFASMQVPDKLQKSFSGIWVGHSAVEKPDAVLYYVHGKTGQYRPHSNGTDTTTERRWVCDGFIFLLP